MFNLYAFVYIPKFMHITMMVLVYPIVGPYKVRVFLPTIVQKTHNSCVSRVRKASRSIEMSHGRCVQPFE